jgi:AcrR family transcriptional regulator
MPRSPSYRRLHRDEQQVLTRRRLLEAAEHEFAHKGFRDASVAAIAERAGYSHGAVYSNFKGKDDLFLVLVEDLIDARLARIYEAADTELSRGTAPLEAARRFMSMLQRERSTYLLLIDFWNQAVRNPQAARKFAARHARLRTIIGPMIESAVHAQGMELTRSGEQVATALIALFNGFTIERLADSAAAPDELLAHATAAIVRGFSSGAKSKFRQRTRKRL